VVDKAVHSALSRKTISLIFNFGTRFYKDYYFGHSHMQNMDVKKRYWSFNNSFSFFRIQNLSKTDHALDRNWMKMQRERTQTLTINIILASLSFKFRSCACSGFEWLWILNENERSRDGKRSMNFRKGSNLLFVNGPKKH